MSEAAAEAQGFRVSPQQRRAWALVRAEGRARTAYGVRAAVAIDGPLETEALGRALGRMAERHEILRTRLVAPTGMALPLQEIAEPAAAKPHAELVDLSGRPSAELEAELERRVAAGAPIDPAAPGPGFELLRLEAERHVLLAAFGAGLADAASVGAWLAELAAEYGALRGEDGGEGGAEGGEEVLQYADFSEWQLSLLEAEESRPGREHWARMDLRRAREASLPFEAPAGAETPFEPRLLTAPVTAETAAGLERLAERLEVVPATLVLAAWQTLLAQLLGQAELVVGVDFDGRRLEELEGALGAFGRHLPIVAEPTADRVFETFVRELEERVDEAGEWQECFAWPEAAWLPFGFGWEERPAPRRAAEVELSILTLRAVTERFTARLAAVDEGGRLRLELQVDPGRLGEADGERLLASVSALLAAAAARPGARLAELDALGPAERLHLMLELNRTAVPAPEDPFLHRWVERHFENAPRHPAVVSATGESEETELTYGELAHRAAALARYLRRLGVGPERVVAIYLERSPEVVVALLAVLQAGGAYLPLDPYYPAERRAFMLRDAGAAVLLTRAGLAAELAEATAETGTRVVSLDTDAAAIAAAAGDALEVALEPEHPAYVIYTSGSTGRPKGVVVSHGNLAASTQARRHHYREKVGVYFLASSFAFDSSVAGIFWTLADGGTLVLPGEAFQLDVPALAAELDRAGVTHLLSLHSLWQLILNEARDDQLAVLGTVIVAGEACPGSLVTRHRERRPGVELHNEYGPTEATVWSTVFDTADFAGEARVPIGRPIENARVYLLGPAGEPVPTGAPGELHLAGRGLARGYLHRPALTAERFVPDPFAGEPGGRLYRTGDLARWQPGDALDFLGRIDDQIKIRGYRVELGEIEAALAKLEGVVEAAVAVHTEAAGERQLVAYAVTAGGAADLDRLRAELAAVLPEPMVPGLFVPLEKLPRTANGKVDRRALPSPEAVRAATRPDYRAPTTAEETALAEIFSEVLGVERVGVDDNFFELGGDSISSVRVRAAGARRGLRFTVQDLFECRTVSRLGERVERAEGEEGTEPERPGPFELISARDRARLGPEIEDAYPLSELQAGMLFHTELEPGEAIYHDIVSFHLEMALEPETLRAALEAVTAAHQVLRTSFRLSEFSEPLQLVHREARVPLGIEDLGGLPESEQEREIAGWIEGEKRRGFDWREPPLVRLQVHRRGGGSFQLSISEHHAILDGWSMATFLTELFEHYLARLEGRAPEAEAPASHFRDFIALERRALASEESREFWNRQIDDPPPTRLLPWTRGRVSGEGEVWIECPPETSAALAALATEIGVPLKSVLLTAHVKALATLTGRRDVITGVVANGRPESADGERVLGLFLNTLPLRRTLLRGVSWRELVADLHAAEAEFLGHRRYPMAELQKHHGGELFHTAFNFIHFHVYDRVRGVPGLRLVGAEAHERTDLPFFAHFSRGDDAEIKVRLVWDRSELDDAHGQAAAEVYRRALDELAHRSGERHESFEPMTAQERRQVLTEYQGPALAGAPASSLVELFWAQAWRTPTAPALDDGERSLSYGELAHRAGELARRLVERGARPEVPVAVCSPRSLEMWVAILAIHAAGAPYLPLDPALPPRRTKFILDDSAAHPVLAPAELFGRLEELGAAVEELPELAAGELLGEGLSAKPPADPPIVPSPGHAAYVIYTSGSTGLPKGVVVGHGAAARHVGSALERLDLGPGERALQFASPSFDVSIEEVWTALASGATAVLAGAEPWPPAELSERLDALGITKLNLPTAYWMEWLAAAEAAPRHLRRVYVSSEALRVAAAEDWRRSPLAGIAHVNAYGPTEAIVHATYYTLGAERPAYTGQSEPIGRLLPARRAYVLGPEGRLLPPGTPGELHLGEMLARGYLGRPALTASRFMPDAFGERPGARLYRTGDRVRHLPGGELQFLGRIDHQVKLRGMRVELGEVEAVLETHPGVGRAAAVIREERPGEPLLVAYAETVSEELGSAELRAYLAERLPAYMVPAALPTLERLPRTATGKIDRPALPAPAELLDRPAPVAPRDPVELELLGLWREALGEGDFGVRDHFFELGGHSLRAVRLMAQIRERWGVELPLATLFEAPTVEALAELLRSGVSGASGVRGPLVAIRAEGDRPPLFLAHPSGGQVLRYAELARHLGADQPVYGLQRAEPGERSLEERAAAHAEALVAARPEGPFHLAGWSMGGLLAFEIARGLRDRGREVALLALVDTRLPEAEGEVDEGALLELFGRQVLGPAADGVWRERFEALAGLEPRERLRRLFELARGEGLLPPGLELGALEEHFELFRHDLRAAAGYRPAPYDGPVLLLRSRESEGDLGWGELAGGGLEIEDLPGDHFSILEPPAVEMLARELSSRLGEGLRASDGNPTD